MAADNSPPDEELLMSNRPPAGSDRMSGSKWSGKAFSTTDEEGGESSAEQQCRSHVALIRNTAGERVRNDTPVVRFRCRSARGADVNFNTLRHKKNGVIRGHQTIKQVSMKLDVNWRHQTHRGRGRRQGGRPAHRWIKYG